MNGRLRRAAACGGLRRPAATACGDGLRPPFATLPACGGLRPPGAPRRRPACVDGFIAIRSKLKTFTRYCYALAWEESNDRC